MNLQHRIDLMVRLGQYILANDEKWKAAKEKASYENGWFIPAFIDLSVQRIAESFLNAEILNDWTKNYGLPADNVSGKKIGIVMAGNIPLVGFHDFLCVFISGHSAIIKPSSKDQTLIKHLAGKIIEWQPEAAISIQFAETLKDCDAYIATGSNNSSRYFEYYFARYPHIIRKNRTSVAILSGKESSTELEKLADDVHLYFGLGCRNVTKIYVPEGYDFIPLLEAFKKYNYLADHHKYKNNFDYNLAIHLLNKKYYMTNGSILLIEEPALFSPISQLNYQFFADQSTLSASLKDLPELQAVVGEGNILFGDSQSPSISDYADGIDTLNFLSHL